MFANRREVIGFQTFPKNTHFLVMDSLSLRLVKCPTNNGTRTLESPPWIKRISRGKRNMLKQQQGRYGLRKTRRYSLLRLLLAPADGFCLLFRLFLALWANKELFMLFLLILSNFWCSVVTSVTFSSNLSNFEKNPRKKTNLI